jgi:hypothetical protein
MYHRDHHARRNFSGQAGPAACSENAEFAVMLPQNVKLCAGPRIVS